MIGSETDIAEEWKKYWHLFQPETVAPRTLLLQEGAVSRTAFFVEKGCLRAWFNHDGRDVTFQFFFEGQGVSSIESFMTGQPGMYHIETIETCNILRVSKSDFMGILEASPILKTMVEQQILERLFFYQKLFLSRIKDKPEQRYKELIAQHPEILQRVPQHYIASYLGITAVSLSRIRNRR